MKSTYEQNVAWAMRQAIWTNPDDPRHGTKNGYVNLKCRCEACRAAWAAWTATARERRAIDLAEDDPRHGQVNTYFNYLCHCAECRSAMNAGARSRYRTVPRSGASRTNTKGTMQ